jgi:hypothetical protein
VGPPNNSTLLKDSTVYRKFETNIPEMKLRGLSPNSYIYVSVSDLNTVFSWRKIVGSTVRIYINCSQKHECGNWD